MVVFKGRLITAWCWEAPLLGVLSLIVPGSKHAKCLGRYYAAPLKASEPQTLPHFNPDNCAYRPKTIVLRSLHDDFNASISISISIDVSSQKNVIFEHRTPNTLGHKIYSCMQSSRCLCNCTREIPCHSHQSSIDLHLITQ